VPVWHYLLISTEPTWQEKNREHLREYNRKYFADWKARDPEGLKAYRRKFNQKYAEKNKARIAANGKKYYARRRGKWLMRSYGVTEEWYVETLAAQGGKCAICPATEPGGPHKVFSVDHDHKTGKVRGLLCKDCNHMLGMAKDSIETLRAAIEYLQKSNS